MFNIEKAKAKGLSEHSIKIMERINENNRKRESCTGHCFELPEHTTLPIKHVCKVCGYEADGVYVMGYNDALRHCGK
jgi:rRNA maturation endonuclease Nob1